MKQAVRKIVDYTNSYRNENDQIILEGDYIINLFKETAAKIPDVWAKDRILDNIKDYERIIKLGLINMPILKTALRELTGLTQGTGPTQEQKEAKELKELERSFISKKIPGFFPTPPALIEKLFSMVKVYEDDTILEPSAGLGHIAQEIKKTYPKNELSLIEWNYDLSEVLRKKGFDDTEHCNFIGTSHKYDVIFMNPPFENGQDIQHVNHAFKLLKPGGRLAAIMAGNKTKQNQETQDFNELVNNNGYIVDNEAGSFKSAFNSTGVNTVTVYLEK
jgi:phospholipid N-methyltransferase